ncbi:hypothetical protein M6B38_261590 [Iris pallida]|uniref:Uncharacterized protein n=1 Tax=Iris pallida TaxID=29817 RepID=A0AAX6IDF6_IRIPA|nr:hypothetical protein M6B38_261590 [Iris pallida]
MTTQKSKKRKARLWFSLLEKAIDTRFAAPFVRGSISGDFVGQRIRE